MSEKSILQLIEEIYSSESSGNKNIPGWWIMIMRAVQEVVHPDMGTTSQWLSLQEALQKVIMCWLNRYKKWGINSLDTLKQKMETLAGGISATLCCSATIDNYIELFQSCTTMENLEETECLDFQSKVITSMSSTTAVSATDPVDTAGGSKLSLLERLNQCGRKTNISTNSAKQTGMMSSSISFLENEVTP